ncbi:MAG: hypothetical protein GXP01_04645 [Alphaproteobacteria bacterium]|nr:hypothetical protein [Alphaproteobacteria bacterium]
MRHLLILVVLGLATATALASSDAPVPPPRPDALANGELMVADGQNPDGAETGPTPGTEPLPDTSATALPAASLAPQAPQPVTLFARVVEGGATIPSGLVWRIYDTKPNERGELGLLAKSSEAVASFLLVPGEYVAHVSYGRAQVSDKLVVERGTNERSIILDVGGLRLSAFISGDVPIPAGQLGFTIAPAETDDDLPAVASAVAPGEMVNLVSGVYKVTSTFGNINAVVRADIRVEPGQLTEATLYHKAAQVTLKLVSEPGGEAIADTEWSVLDFEGETLFTAIGAFGNLVLAEGEYTVIAKLGTRVFNRDFQILAGRPTDVEVVTGLN